MRETLKNIYDAHQWVRVLSWVTLVGVALLFCWLAGGSLPPVWIQLWQSIVHIFHQSATSGTYSSSVSLTFMVLLIVRSLLWLAAWMLLLWCALRLWRHHRGLKERLVRRAAWQTTQRIADLDAFSFPGEHTLVRTMMDEEIDVDEESNGIELRPPIRLPQHTQLNQYAHSAGQKQDTRQMAVGSHVPYPPHSSRSSHPSRPSRAPIPQRTHAASSGLSLVADSAQRGPQLVAVKDMADIPTTPVPPSTRTHASASQDMVQQSHRTLARVAVEDIPTKPQPPSLANIASKGSAQATPTTPSTPSARRTIRLDTSAHTQAVSQPKPSKSRPALALETGVGWHTGLTRQNQPNEDSVVTLRGMCTYREQLVPFGLFVVADGMGGHACGQEASRIAIRTLAQSALRDIMQPETLDDKQL
ncbi:MAG TPA: hypothetical protein DHW02_18900, partial [Ktedonobacter sp.]|nr:hypothetical protein [Ktedonobacter sp.]